MNPKTYGPAAAERDEGCAAYGCPNRWTVDMGNGRLCSAHDLARPERWPEVTEQQLWDETERARQSSESAPKRAGPKLTIEDKSAIARRLAEVVRNRSGADPTAWAYALRFRDESGERLTAFQRSAWRYVLDMPPIPSASLRWVNDEEQEQLA